MDRIGFIGGSDVHHIFSLPPYGCAAKLWDDKRGVPEDYPEIYNPLFERGHALEPLIRGMYADSQPRSTVVEGGSYHVHKEHTFIAGHVDGTVSLCEGSPGTFEAKTAGREMFYKMKREGLPEAYILQMQHYLLVTGLKWGVYAILWPDGWQLESFRVACDEELIAQIEQAEISFWRQVENGPRPEKLSLEDKRCQKCTHRNSCQGDKLLELYKLNGDEKELPNMSDNVEYLEFAENYIKAKQVADESTMELDIAKGNLKECLGDNLGAYGGGLKIHYKPVKSMRWNTKQLEKDMPELAAKYKKESTSRPFRAYILGE